MRYHDTWVIRVKQGYLIDLDGTMFRGTQACLGAIDWINLLHYKNIPFAFLTNNSSRTQQQACEHMVKMGFQNISPEHFFTSAMAASRYIAKYYAKRKVFAIGSEGLMNALSEMGFELVDQNADFVFVGMTAAGNVGLYSRALREIMKGAIFVGTNNDRRIPLDEGLCIGNGSVIALLEYASGIESIKIGKPYPPMMETALEYLGLQQSSCILVGDNLETDIMCGVQAGIDTVLVLGGVHGREDCDRLQVFPTRIVSGLQELIDEMST